TPPLGTWQGPGTGRVRRGPRPRPRTGLPTRQSSRRDVSRAWHRTWPAGTLGPRLSPALPVDDLLGRAPALCEPARPLAGLVVVGAPADRDAAGDLDVVRKRELVPEGRERLDEDAEQAGRVALVDRREQDQHRGGSGIEIPERDRPLDLDAAGQRKLVGLAVPLVVVGLAQADDDQHRCIPDP